MSFRQLVRNLRKAKQIKIEESIAINDSCNFMLYARGHFEDRPFITACNLYLREQLDRKELRATVGPVRRTYWRRVPLKDNICCDFQFIESGKGRGAFPVTVHERWMPIHREVAR
jgi:hypothetical protein